MRFHVLGLAHTATSKEYCGCAFTQKILNLCKMLKNEGHYVIHYGNEGSQVECSEHVQIHTKDKILGPTEFLQHDQCDTESMFNAIVIGEVARHKQPHDFLLCPWLKHKPIADIHGDMIVVESGIGYGGGTFAPYKVFESYAILHAYYGNAAVVVADKFEWYNRVIPNYFDANDFRYNDNKQDYILFLGMRHGGIGKGYQIAVDACRDAGVKLLVAGPDAPIDSPEHVEYLGLLDVEHRKEYLANARALIAPSLFLEPFCGAQVEAFISGTPVISTDWGAFAEYNIHGKTGFRCHTHADFIQAIKAVTRLDHGLIRNYSKQFWLDAIAPKYTDFFKDIMKIYTGKGWYEV